MLKATVIGNIGGDAEVKQTQNGRAYLSFSVAHDRGREQPATWVRIAWFGGVDHPVRQHLRRGAKLCVTGDLRVSQYIDRSSQYVAGIDIYADTVDVVLFPKREEAAPAPAAAPAHHPGYVPAGTPPSYAHRGYAAPAPEPAFGPGNPEYDRMPDFLKNEDLPE